MDNKDNFKIFENYKCDGQLSFIDNEGNMEIVEDTNETKNTTIDKNHKHNLKPGQYKL